MQKRIGALIATDGICVVPICIIAFLSYAGVEIPKDTYIVTTCFLLPINSALNPVIYSKLGKRALVRGFRWIKSSISRRSGGGSTLRQVSSSNPTNATR